MRAPDALDGGRFEICTRCRRNQGSIRHHCRGLESGRAAGLSFCARRFRDGDGVDRARARSAGHRRADARWILADGASASVAQLRSPRNSSDRPRSGDRDWSIHSHRRRSPRPHRLVLNDLGPHAEGMADGPRPLIMMISKTKIIPTLALASSVLVAACGDSSGPGSVDANAALQSLALGLQSGGGAVGSLTTPDLAAAFGGIAPLLTQT